MTNTKRLALALAASAIAITSAQAGGFSRGNANLDGLYASEDGNEPVTAYAGVTFVSPGRSYENIEVDIVGTNVQQDGDIEFAEDFSVPFASVGLKFNDQARCVGSYSVPYGGDSEYEGPVTFQIASQEIETFELGATCSYGVQVGRGMAYAIGGVFYENLEYRQSRDFTQSAQFNAPAGTQFAAALAPFGLDRFFDGPVTGNSSIDVSSEDVGFRVGAAYEIPEIALRASLIYRSETNHDVDGSFSNTPLSRIFQLRAAQAALAGDLVTAGEQGAFAGASAGQFDSTATGSATLPQQLELNLRSGVAAGTLVFGSVRWTDWSVVQQIDLNDGFSNSPFTDFKGFFDDGWTVTLGVGRAFTEDLAGSLAVTWDEGVGTGFDTFTDTYTLAGGLAYDLNEVANIRGGGALVYFTEGEKTQGDFTAESPSEFGFALSAGLNIKF